MPSAPKPARIPLPEPLAALRELAMDAFERMDAAGVRIFSAGIAYRAIFATVSLASAVLLVTWVVGSESSELQRLITVLPDDVEDIAADQAVQIASLASSTVALATAVGLVFALWGLIGGFTAVFDALNRIHGSWEYRRMTRRYVRAGMVAFGFMATLGLAWVVVILGSDAGIRTLELLGMTWAEPLVSGVARAVAVPLLALLGFALTYRYGSLARPPWSEVAMSTVLATAAWSVLAMGSKVAMTISTPLEAYGALASAVALLLFGYWSAYVFLCAALFAPDIVRGISRFRRRPDTAAADD